MATGLFVRSKWDDGGKWLSTVLGTSRGLRWAPTVSVGITIIHSFIHVFAEQASVECSVFQGPFEVLAGSKGECRQCFKGGWTISKKKIISAFTRSKTRPSEAGEGVGREWWLGGSAILYRIVRRWHWDRDLERSGNQACGVWRNDVPGRRDSQCEGSEPEHDSYVWGRARRPRGWK